MNKIVSLLSIGLSCCSLAVGTPVKVWNFTSGKVPPPQEMGRWPGQGCQITVSNNELTPDGQKTLEIAIDKERDGNGIGARQVILSCPNRFLVRQRIKVSFLVKASQATTLRVATAQRNVPYGSFNKLNFSEIAVQTRWQPFVWEFEVEKVLPDREVTLPRLMFGKAEAGTRLWLGPIAVEETSGSVPVSLNQAANMGFVDPVAGDGKGGWSDQGPGNDFHQFNFRQKTFCGISIPVIDPEENHGKAVISFRCPQFTNGAQRAVLPVEPPARGKYLYLLHTACWVPPAGVALGQVAVTFTDGTVRQYPVTSGTELRDWWGPQAAANALVGFENNNLGVYLSRFPLPDKEAKQVELTTTGKGMWIVVGAVLSDREAKGAAVDVTAIVANREWQPIDTADLAVKPGSALDLSALFDPSPAGTFGRVVADDAGKTVFASRPDVPVRFRSSAMMPGVGGLAKMTHPQLSELADTVARQGYNMVRLHFLDCWLTDQQTAPWQQVKRLNLPQTPEAVRFNPAKWDKLDFFIAELKKRGVYLYLDAMTSYLGYALDANLYVYGPHHELVAQSYLFGDLIRRNNWKAGVTKLLTHVNPYTGLALRDDPILAVLLFCNEQDLLPAHIKSTPTVLLPAWRKFLEQKYHDFAALYRAWDGKYGDRPLDRNGGFAAVPPIDANVSYGNSRAGIDTTLFFDAAAREMTEFYQQTIKKIGYSGLTSQWDFIPRLLEIPARALMPVVSMHTYHAHPTSYLKPGSRIVQESSLRQGGNSFKQCGPTRLLNRPFMIMEFGIVFWNRYRHEQGLLFGAGAAFQDYNALNLHGGTARLGNSGQEMKPFNNAAVDPISRASEVVTAFAYLRGDVAAARHTVAFSIDNRYIFSGRAMNAFSDELSLLWAVSKIGIIYREDAKAPGKADLILEPGGVSKLKYQVGAAGTEASPQLPDSLKSAIAKLRRSGLLPAGNQTDPDKGILQSDTGEFRLDITKGELQVITPRLEGVTVKTDHAVKLGKVTVKKCSVPAAITLISLDKNAAVAQSGRLLLVFATDALNSGMKFTSPERTELINIGKQPVLLQTGRLTLSLDRQVPVRTVSVFPLKLTGERLAKVPVRLEGNRLELELDTARLPSGPTPFFEIVID